MNITTKICACSLLAAAGTAHGATLFTNGDATDDNINRVGNWDNGLPTGGNVGTITQNATWQPDLGGGTAAAANKLVGYSLEISGTSGSPITFRRTANFIPEIENTTISLTHAAIDSLGSRVFRLSGTSVLTLNEGGELTTASNRSVEFQNDGAGQGQIVMKGGTLTSEGLGLATDNASYAFLQFEAEGGTVDITDTIDFTGDENLFINFLSGSSGILDIAAADASYYSGLWDSGNLKVDGANAGTFASNFNVSGGVLTLVPEPSSLALLGLGGLLIARRRR